MEAACLKEIKSFEELTFMYMYAYVSVVCVRAFIYLYLVCLWVPDTSLKERICPFCVPWIYLLNYMWKNIKIYKAIITDRLNFMGICILIDNHKGSAVKVILQLYLENHFHNIT